MKLLYRLSVLFILSVLELQPGGSAQAGDASYSSQFKPCQSFGLESSEGCHDPGGASLAEIANKSAALEEPVFREELRSNVHDFLKASERQTRHFEACAKSMTTQAPSESQAQPEGDCAFQINRWRQAVRNDWHRMRILLAVARPEVDQEVLDPSDMAIFNHFPAHRLSGLSPLDPLSENEIEGEDGARVQAKRDLDQAGASSLAWDDRGHPVDGTGIQNLSDSLFSGHLRISVERQRQVLSRLKEIRNKHYAEYLAILENNPLIGFISKVDLNNPNSPSNAEIAEAFGDVSHRLHDTLKSLRNGHDAYSLGCQDSVGMDGVITPCLTAHPIHWDEYLKYTSVIHEMVSLHPEYCQLLDPLKKEAELSQFGQKLRNTVLGAAAGGVAMVAGPFGLPVSLLLEGGVGGLEVYDAQQSYNQALARNLSLALQAGHSAHYLELQESQNQVGLREFFLPLMMFGANPIAKETTVSGGLAAKVTSLRQADTLVGKGKDAAAIAVRLVGPRNPILMLLEESLTNVDESQLIVSHLEPLEKRFEHNQKVLHSLKQAIVDGKAMPQLIIVSGTPENGGPPPKNRNPYGSLIQGEDGTWWVMDAETKSTFTVNEWFTRQCAHYSVGSCEVEVHSMTGSQ